jgi:hypothetical protein
MRASNADALVRRYALVDGHGDEVNVRLRVVANEVWLFHSQEIVCPPFAALDMIKCASRRPVSGVRNARCRPLLFLCPTSDAVGRMRVLNGPIPTEVGGLSSSPRGPRPARDVDKANALRLAPTDARSML